MNYSEFADSLSKANPPENLSDVLVALWHERKGNWDKAHDIVQDMPTRDASWVHAYLHRKEGDSGNASYWYGRADKKFPNVSLDEEWEALVKNFLPR